MTPSEGQIRDAIAQQAGEWFVANQSGVANLEDRTAFVAWLKASPLHVEEYLGVALVARDLAFAANDPSLPLEELISQARSETADAVVAFEHAAPTARRVKVHRTPSRALPLAIAASALLVVVASAVWWLRDGELLGLPRTYQAAHGEQLVKLLPDGSELRLNTDSAVTVRYVSRERVVSVDRGQALFQVVHDSGRRFRVIAGDAEIVDAGTRFDVYRKLDSTIITVAEGQVAVFHASANGGSDGGGIPPFSQRVNAGYQLSVDAGILADHAVPVDLHRTLAWLEHRIAFERRPLGEVADEFNRYGTIPLEIDDAGLRALPVSGVFDAYDIASFARFLTTLDGVVVEKTATRIRVLRMTPEKQEPITTAR